MSLPAESRRDDLDAEKELYRMPPGPPPPRPPSPASQERGEHFGSNPQLICLNRLTGRRRGRKSAKADLVPL